MMVERLPVKNQAYMAAHPAPINAPQRASGYLPAAP